MSKIKSKIVGLRWRQFDSKPLKNEEDVSRDKSPPRENVVSSQDPHIEKENGVKAPQKSNTLGRRLSRAVSVNGMREIYGSFRQKVRASTRRRKRLFEISSPYRTVSEVQTPTSATRRSSRIAERNGTAMYSPFGIDTPKSKSATTPGKIRMGTHEPKRFNFSSPGQLQRDLNTVEESLRQLNKLSENLSGVTSRTPRSSIRTTPGGRRTSRRKQIFV